MHIAPIPSPSRQPFLDRELARWRSWEVVSRCGSGTCQPNPSIPVAAVLRARGEGLTLAGLARHLRCAGCQEVPRDVGLRRRPECGGEIWQRVQGEIFW